MQCCGYLLWSSPISTKELESSTFIGLAMMSGMTTLHRNWLQSNKNRVLSGCVPELDEQNAQTSCLAFYYDLKVYGEGKGDRDKRNLVRGGFHRPFGLVSLPPLLSLPDRSWSSSCRRPCIGRRFRQSLGTSTVRWGKGGHNPRA